LIKENAGNAPRDRFDTPYCTGCMERSSATFRRE